MNAAEKKIMANKLAKDNYKLTGLKDRKIWNQCVKDAWAEVNADSSAPAPKTETPTVITGKEMIITVSLMGFVSNWRTLETNTSHKAAHVWKRKATAEKFQKLVAAKYPDADVEVQTR